jgi:predicted flap endonuclease-1-like 5' DNA nuclease
VLDREAGAAREAAELARETEPDREAAELAREAEKLAGEAEAAREATEEELAGEAEAAREAAEAEADAGADDELTVFSGGIVIPFIDFGVFPFWSSHRLRSFRENRVLLHNM